MYYKTQLNQLYERKNMLEAVLKCSVLKVFLKISQNSQENTYVYEHLFYRTYPSISLKLYSMAPLNIVYFNKKKPCEIRYFTYRILI